MKNLLRGMMMCCIIALSLLFYSNCYAQETELYSKSLEIGMTVPKDFKVTSNSVVEFSASDKDLSLIIHPFYRNNLSLDNMDDILIEHAGELGYRSLSNAETIELNGFQGCYAVDKGNGKNSLVMLLINQQSNKNLFIVINYPDKTEKTALSIANSFYIYN